MITTANYSQLILLLLLMLSSVGVLYVRNPVHAALSFLVTLLTLSAFYLELRAPFIAAIQVLIYAGAIMVIFMFVVILFQDAHSSIEHYRSKCHPAFLYSVAASFLLAFFAVSWSFLHESAPARTMDNSIGSVMSIGHSLYIDFFLPFEIVFLLFIVALVGALYIGKKET